MAPKANCTQRRQEVSHNSLGTSYCRIPAKRTGILRKMSAFIAGRNGADREVEACFARGGTGRYRTLKVNTTTTSVCIINKIAFKGTIFHNLLTAPQTVSNTYSHVVRAQSCANHVQHIKHSSSATCRVACHVVQRESSASKFDSVEIAFTWALSYWMNHLLMKDWTVEDCRFVWCGAGYLELKGCV